MINTVTENELNPPFNDPLYSAIEAAQYLEISKSTFHKLVREKAFPVVRFIGDVRVQQSDLNLFIKEHKTWGLFTFEWSN